MSPLRAEGFPEAAVRDRAARGISALFPDVERYGGSVFGAAGQFEDRLDRMRIVPPVFTPHRLEALVELGREPSHTDVDLTTDVGGLRSPLPLFVSALGSTAAAGGLGVDLAAQAGSLGLPLVIGENVVPVSGYRKSAHALASRLAAYAGAVPDGLGGLVVQQGTEDADAEVWNLVHTDPATRGLLDSGRLAFELKVGQGAKPGLGGMTVMSAAAADALPGNFVTHELVGPDTRLRCSVAGTFTAEILRQQIRLMRNNFPRCRIWVKLPPCRDVAEAAEVGWRAGADAVTVDGAEGGTGWAPTAFLDGVGLPLVECLGRVLPGSNCLLATGRMWEATRVLKSLALGVRAAGLGRAALLAVDEDAEHGLRRLVDAFAFELRLLVSALGKYRSSQVDATDVWSDA